MDPTLDYCSFSSCQVCKQMPFVSHPVLPHNLYIHSSTIGLIVDNLYKDHPLVSLLLLNCYDSYE